MGLGVTRKLMDMCDEVTVVTLPMLGENPVPGTRWIQIDRKDREGFQNALKDGGYEYVMPASAWQTPSWTMRLSPMSGTSW